jgi:hypothetical protein
MRRAESISKVNFGSAITADAMKFAVESGNAKIVIILLAANADYTHMVDILIEMGCKVIVGGCGIQRDLREATTHLDFDGDFIEQRETN